MRLTTLRRACVVSIVLATMLAWVTVPVAATIQIHPAPPARPLIQIAILLDTSSSMSGLIDQARRQLWGIVNELAAAKCGGQRPQLQVALYEYGKSSIPAGEGHLRMILGLTTDLDKVSQDLFTLKTNGGDEYCGLVIQSAVEGLQWSNSHGDYKAIFIAGNESFAQGSVDYRKTCKAAITKGIIVNTIHCGSRKAGISGQWENGAQLTDGSFTNIEHNRVITQIKTPYDAELVRLNEELNKTYISYGTHGKDGAANQRAQDANAANLSIGVMAQRVQSKASAVYRNAHWDLVNAHEQKKVNLDELKDEDLPELMRGMSLRQRGEHVAQTAKRRAEVQQSVKRISALREQFIAKAAGESSQKPDSLGSAMIRALREQAGKRSITFDKK